MKFIKLTVAGWNAEVVLNCSEIVGFQAHTTRKESQIMGTKVWTTRNIDVRPWDVASSEPQDDGNFPEFFEFITVLQTPAEIMFRMNDVDHIA